MYDQSPLLNRDCQFFWKISGNSENSGSSKTSAETLGESKQSGKSRGKNNGFFSYRGQICIFFILSAIINVIFSVQISVSTTKVSCIKL